MESATLIRLVVKGLPHVWCDEHGWHDENACPATDLGNGKDEG
jgi:hypothetical protein